jgi:hypothetical protein
MYHHRVRMQRGRVLATLLLFSGCTQPFGEGGAIEPPKPPPVGGTDDGGTRIPPSSEPYVASDSVVRRLSQAELDRSLEDLFGDATDPATQFLLEDEFSPYDNDYSLQDPSQALIDAVDVMATDVSERLIADPIRRDMVVPCTPTDAGDADCFRAFIESFGERVFRRALSPDEVEPYLELLAYATEDNAYVENDFYTAVALAIQAMLQDPEFLYRVEWGTATSTAGVIRLDPFAVSARMSFLLWGSTPDDALLADAAAGRLDTPAERRVVAARMLDDPRARSQLNRFHSMWLGYRAIPHPAQLVNAFAAETTELIDRVVFDDKRSYLDVFTSSETYVDDFLADHYGMARPANGAGWVAYQDPMRAGILSHGSVLASFSKFTDTSPTQRGILVRTRLMCQEVPSPPADVDVDQPPATTADAVCKKDRYAAHISQSTSCFNCHSGMDPIGFGLENYDIAGRFRETDDGLPQCTIDGNGNLPDGQGQFRGPKALAEKLIELDLIQRCVVRQYYRYAIGRRPKPIEDQPIDALIASFETSGWKFDQLMLDFVASEGFALKKEVQ